MTKYINYNRNKDACIKNIAIFIDFIFIEIIEDNENNANGKISYARCKGRLSITEKGKTVKRELIATIDANEVNIIK